MSTNSPPLGFIFRSAPQSVQEAVSRSSHDRIKSITKACVQKYISDFMDTMGVKRSITEAVGSLSKMFITDVDMPEDPTQRKTQLARYFNDIKERLPAILIVESGMEWVPPGFHNLDHVTHFGAKGELGQPMFWQGTFPLTYNVALSIIAATHDQESTDALGGFLSLIFGALRNASGGSRLTGRGDKGDTWEVRLPLSFVTSATTNSAINDDPKDAVWSMTIDVLVQFEDSIRLEQTIPQIDFPPTGVAISSSLDDSVPPVIFFDDTIKLGETKQIRVKQLQNKHKIVLSDGRIATFDPETLIVSPRKLGKFEIQVINEFRRQSSGAALAPVVVARKEVEVIL